MRFVASSVLFLLLAGSAQALTFNTPLTVSSTGTSDSQAVMFSERVENAGRLHLVWVSGGKILYRRETTAGAGAFSSEVTVGTAAANASVGSPDLFVDDTGVAHVVWIQSGTGFQEIWYASVSGGNSVSGRAAITPAGTTQAAYPQVVARRFSAGGVNIPIVVYVGRDPIVNNQDTEILSLTRISGWVGPNNLTSDTVSGESNLAFDAVGALEAPAVIQAAIVYEQNGRIFAMMSEGNSASALFFSAPVLLTPSLSGTTPDLAVQSVTGASNGYVGHVVFRSTVSSAPVIQYLQFAALPDSGTVNTETLTVESQVFGSGQPSISVLPDSGVANRFNRQVLVGWTANNALRLRRNNGGLSGTFNLVAGSSQPISTFSDAGTAGSGVLAEGPGAVTAIVYNGTSKARAIATEGNGALLLYNESGLPNPTATPTPAPTTSPIPTATLSPTATPSPTPTGATATPTIAPTVSPTSSPTPIIIGTATPIRTTTPTPLTTPSPSATPRPTFPPTVSPTPAGPSVTPTPYVVNGATILDTLVSFIRTPTASEFAQGDRNADDVWDAGDLVKFLNP